MKVFIKPLVSFFTFAVIFGFTAVSEVNAQLDEILKRMDAHNKALTSLRADVTMEKYNSQIRDTDTTKGTVMYRPRSGRRALVRVDWVSPNETLSVVDNTYVIYRPRISQAITGNVNTAGGANGSIFEFMNMDRQQLRENYSIVYLGETTVSAEGTWHLRLTPKKQTNYKSAEIWVNKDGMPVRTKVVERNDDTTTVTLSAVRKNVNIDNSQFKVNLPRGTKIVKS